MTDPTPHLERNLYLQKFNSEHLYTLSYSSVVEFSTIGRVISIEAQNCFCEEQALFSLQ